MNTLLKGKTILIMGVANKWSIAWGIAEACLDAGANFIFTYQGERNLSNLQKLTADLPNISLYKCDVTEDQDIIDLFHNIGNDYGTIHGIVHSIAFAKKEELEGAYYNTSRRVSSGSGHQRLFLGCCQQTCQASYEGRRQYPHPNHIGAERASKITMSWE